MEFSCEWCGGDGYFEDELTNGKCKTCQVNDCRHKNTYREVGKITQSIIEIKEECLGCSVFRKIVLPISEGLPSKWCHEEINDSDIYQD